MALYAVWRSDDRRGKVSLALANGPAEATEAVARREMSKCLDRGYVNLDHLNGVYLAARIETEPPEKVTVEENYGHVSVRREEE